MGDKKHIDRLFQEGFKDFEATPSDAVWKNIEANLNEKDKKRRVIPIWWRYAGVAALFLLLLTVGNLLFNNSENSAKNQVVDVETVSEEESNPIISNPVNSENTLEQPVANNNILEGSLNETSEYKSTLNKEINKSSIANNQSNKNEAESISNNNKPQALAKYNIENKQILKENIASKETTVSTNIENSNLSNENSERLIDKASAKEIINESSETNIAKTNVDKETSKSKTLDNGLSIEEAIKKNNNRKEETNKTNRWSIAPNAAPVYFNTLGKGSSIGQQFNNNSKTGDVNMSYGISTSYALNKKIKVRSGINRVNLGYNTNDVIVLKSSVSTSSALKNVDSSGSNNSDVSVVSENASKAESFSSSNTSINQSLGYIEIPLEIQYSLSERRLGVNVIGGFSSFFLNNNSVHSENANGQRTFLGEASNINNTSYSANFGVGLNYKFSKTIDLNLEPTFKYQFNTFNNTTGNFTPYFIGVYTGFAIKF
jgi:hypothetical protein